MTNDESKSPVVLYTERYVVHGRIALYAGSRLTDYMRQSEDFIAVTGVVVTDVDGQEIFRADFVNVRRECVALAIPAELHHPTRARERR
jgi:hypothetical protein